MRDHDEMVALVTGGSSGWRAALDSRGDEIRRGQDLTLTANTLRRSLAPANHRIMAL